MYSGEQPLKAGSACLSGDTIVATPAGLRTVGELEAMKYKDQFILASNDRFRNFDRVVKMGKKKTYTVTLENGLSIRATDDHRFDTVDGLVELKNLEVGNGLKVLTNQCLPISDTGNKLYEMLGYVYTNGWITTDEIGFEFPNKDKPLVDSFLYLFKDFFKSKKINTTITESGAVISIQNKQKKTWEDLNQISKGDKFKKLPRLFYMIPASNQLSFIRGVFSACGKMKDIGTYRNTCTSRQEDKEELVYSFNLKSIHFIKDIQKVLMLRGIESWIEIGEDKKRRLRIYGKSGRLFNLLSLDTLLYKSDLFEMDSLIHSLDEVDVASAVKYLEEIVLYNEKHLNNKEYLRIVSIKKYKVEQTYDVQNVRETNLFYGNGISVHNCDLGSINLYKFVDSKFSKTPQFQFNRFAKTIATAIEGLDVLIDENADNHALEKQKNNSLNYRNIGLGVYGYADMLMAMKLKYGSAKALKFTDKLFDFMFKEAVFASNKLAKKLGTFPKYSDKIWESRIIKNHFSQTEIDKLKVDGLRNCSLLSIAPTGSIATMFQMSGGTEPEFSLSYTRKTESLDDGKDKYYTIYAKVAKDYLDINDTVDLPEYFITAPEVKWEDRVDTQAIIQKHIDTAISSTVNLPEETTIETVENIYMRAWQKKIKGITIFRENCERVAILTTDADKTKTQEPELKWGDVIESSQNLLGLKRKLVSGCGTEYIFAYFDPITGDLRETFVAKGSTGACIHNLTGLSRMTSLALRAGAPFDMVIDQLNSTGVCPSYAVRSATKHDTSKGACCPMAIGNALIEMRKEALELIASGISGTFDSTPIEIIDTGNDKCTSCESCSKPTKEIVDTIDPNKILCPQCGEELTMSGGCDFCKSCGYSHCD